MSDSAIDGAIEDVENKTSKRGPRARYYFLAATRTGKKIIHEIIEANEPSEARELFKEKHELEAQVCEDGSSLDGGGTGFYLAMGTGKSAAQRISVTVTPKQLMQRTAKAITAEFKGWEVYGSGLKGCEIEGKDYDDDELVSIEFGNRIDPKSNVSKPKLKKREVIRISDLDNVQVL